MNSVTCGCLYGFGDWMAQNIERSLNIQSKGKTHYNYERTARMFLGGFCFAGPVLSAWFPMLHKATALYRTKFRAVPNTACLYEKIPRPKLHGVAAKVFFDNVFFQAPFLTAYMSVMGLLEGLNPKEIKVKVKNNFHDAWAYSFCLWPLVGCFNFYVVPVPFQPLLVNCVNCGWQTFLSLLYHSRDYGPDAAPAPPATTDAASSGS